MNNTQDLVDKVLERTKVFGSFLWHKSMYSLDVVISDKENIVRVYCDIMQYILAKSRTIKDLMIENYLIKDYIANKLYVFTKYEDYKHYILNKKLPSIFSITDIFEIVECKNYIVPDSYNLDDVDLSKLKG